MNSDTVGRYRLYIMRARTHTHTHTHTHRVEYYLAIKNNEILPFAMMWIELESIMLSEISQSKKRQIYDFTHL